MCSFLTGRASVQSKLVKLPHHQRNDPPNRSCQYYKAQIWLELDHTKIANEAPLLSQSTSPPLLLLTLKARPLFSSQPHHSRPFRL